jgi:predicted HTH domain antitoxin
MAITLELPPGMEERLRAEAPDIDFEREAKVGLAIELFRNETIGKYELGLILGSDRYDTDTFLKKRGEFAQCLTVEEVLEDAENLRRWLKEEELTRIVEPMIVTTSEVPQSSS